MRKLSRCKRKTRYAYCYVCGDVFIDDIICNLDVHCPNGCRQLLERGLDKDDKRVKTHKGK